MPRKILRLCTIALTVLVAVGLLASCSGGNTNPPPSATGSPTPATQSSPTPEKTGFEKDLDYVRKGQYTYIWVFSRKDGRPLDKIDGAYLRTNAPQVVDWVTTDEGKKVIAGTNFDLEKGNLSLLKKRYIVEDYTGK